MGPSCLTTSRAALALRAGPPQAETWSCLTPPTSSIDESHTTIPARILLSLLAWFPLGTLQKIGLPLCCPQTTATALWSSIWCRFCWTQGAARTEPGLESRPKQAGSKPEVGLHTVDPAAACCEQVVWQRSGLSQAVQDQTGNNAGHSL
jgi:hypothetical protein